MKFCLRSLSLWALVFVVLSCLPVSAAPSVTSLGKPSHPTFLSLPITNEIQSLLPSVPVTPAPAPAAENDATAAPAEAEPQETFGTRALTMILAEAELLRTESDTVATNFAAWPQLSTWFQQQFNDQKLQARWIACGNDLVVAVAPSLIAVILFDILLLPARNSLRRRHPATLSRRIGLILTLLGLRLLPILVFIGASLTLLDQNETLKFPRFVTLNVVYALTLSSIVRALCRSLCAPRTEALRIIPATSQQAVYAYRWMTAFSYVIIYGYFLIDVARGIHIPNIVITAFGNLLGLVLVFMTLVVIIQKRAFVATVLRGNLSAANPDLTLLQNLRLWFARHWHVLAMSYLIIGYLITALGVENGFVLMLRGTILTLLILTLMRLALHGTDRLGTGKNKAENSLHYIILRALIRLTIWVSAALAIVASWGANVPALLTTPFGQRISGASFSIGTTIFIVALIYGACNSAIEGRLNRRDTEGKLLQASARVRTLLPMIRNTVFIVFAVIVALVVLSEVGFNIGPLLAGAGIFGVAIGFGSQTLVKDFLTGLFIVIENTIAIGDVVKIGDHSGVVDAMSIRTLRLRDNDGALHILPFSEVTQIINMTKDYAFALIDVGVSYSSNLDHVMGVIREVGEELQKDPIFKRVILEPIEVLGVEKLGDSSITLRSRIRTRPGKQWDVRRIFLLKLVQRFEKEGIEIPFPTTMQITKPHTSS